MRLRIIENSVATSVFVELERRFHGRDYDSPEEGDIEVYRVGLRDPEGRLLSSASLMISRGTGIGRVSDLETTKSERNRGYASRLYEGMVGIARELGVNELRSDSSCGPATRRIWRGLGAMEYGRVYRLVL